MKRSTLCKYFLFSMILTFLGTSSYSLEKAFENDAIIYSDYDKGFHLLHQENKKIQFICLRTGRIRFFPDGHQDPMRSATLGEIHRIENALRKKFWQKNIESDASYHYFNFDRPFFQLFSHHELVQIVEKVKAHRIKELKHGLFHILKNNPGDLSCIPKDVRKLIAKRLWDCRYEISLENKFRGPF